MDIVPGFHQLLKVLQEGSPNESEVRRGYVVRESGWYIILLYVKPEFPFGLSFGHVNMRWLMCLVRIEEKTPAF
jgi:hypothetical protein